MPKTILVIAHHSDTMTLIKNTLQDRYHLWTFRSEEAALETVSQGITPQLAIVPVKAGTLNIAEFKKELNKFSLLKRMPIIAYASAEERIAHREVLQEANRVLTEPLNSYALATAVDLFLGKPRGRP